MCKPFHHCVRSVKCQLLAHIGRSFTGVKSASRSFRKVAMASGNCDGGSFECTLLHDPHLGFLSGSTLEVQ